MIIETISDIQEEEENDIAPAQFGFSDPIDNTALFREAQDNFDWQEANQRRDELQPFILDFDNSADDEVKGWVKSMADMSGDGDRWKQHIQNNAVIGHFMDTDGLDDTLTRGIKRDLVAQQEFGGVGIGDDAAFHAEAVKYFTKRKDTKDMLGELEAEAMKTAITSGGITEYGGSFQQWKATNATRAGYEPDKEAVYYEAWQRSQKNIERMTSPFRSELDAVWENFVGGKEFEKAPKVSEENIPAFLAALSLRVKTLPLEEQPKFWDNLSKQTLRDVNGIVVNVGNAAQIAANSVPMGASVGNAGGGLASLFADVADDFSLNNSDDYSRIANEARAQQQAARDLLVKQKDFEADIRRIQQGSYDPVKQLISEDRTFLHAVEKGVYAMPGAVATTATAMLPGIGLPATFAHLQQSAYHDLRWKMIDNGASREDARRVSEGLSIVIAAPQMVLEKLQAKALTGKLPFFNQAVTSMANKVGGGLAGAALRTGTAAFQETGIELAQDYWAKSVQDMGNALTKDVPDVQWLGDGGVWDGFWADSVTTFVAVAPLSIFAGAGQFRADAVTSAHASASDAQLRAYGYGTEAVVAMREAEKKGIASHIEAIEKAQVTRNASSDEAKAAVAEIEAEAKAQQELTERAQALGMQPFFRLNTDQSITLVDSVTNEEIVTTRDSAEAGRIAFEHMGLMEEKHAATVAQLAAELSTMQAQTTDGTTDGRAVQFEFRPFERRSAKDQVAMNPQNADRAFEQLGIVEGMEHGANLEGSFIKGFSRTTFENDIYTTTNTIFASGDILTTFHEDAHGMRRQAMRDGRFTREEQILGFRAINEGLRRVSGKNAPKLFLLDPATDTEVADDAVTETMLDEAFAELMESEVLRVAKLGGNASPGANKRAIGELANAIDAGAAADPIFAKALSKIRGMMRYLRAKYGEVFNRSLGLKRAIERGDINEGEYQAFLDKIAGRSDVTTANEQAVETAREVIDGVDRVTYSDGSVVDEPFSITPAGVGTRAITTKQDAAYLAAVEEKDMETAQRMVDEAARAAGYSMSHRQAKPVVSRKGDVILFVDDSSANTSYGSHNFAVKDLPEVPAYVRDFAEEYYGEEGQAEPSDILESAQAWDDRQFVSDLWQKFEDRFLSEGIIGFKTPDGGVVFDRPTAIEQNAIKSADPVTRDADGNVIPLSQRFDEQSDDIRFSISRKLSHSDQLTALQSLAAKLSSDPKRKRAIMKRASDNLQKQRRDVQRDIRAFGKDAKTRALSEERTRQNIVREAKMRQALRRQELEDAAYAQFSGMIDQPDLTKLTSQPIHAYLHNPASPLKGRIRSRGATAKMQGDMLQDINLADYDGAEGVNRSVFGGNEGPDQIAQELYDNGLLKQATPDALWDALRKEQNSVAGMKELMRKAKAEFNKAKVTARDETAAWQKAEEKRQGLEHSLHAKIIRAFGMLDGILYALPAEVRGKVGVHTATLAKIKSDEKRLEYLSSALEKANDAMEAHLKKEFQAELKDLLERAKPKGKAGEKAKSDMGAKANRYVAKVREFVKLDEKGVQNMQAGIDERMAETVDPDELAAMAEDFQLVSTFGNFSKKTAAEMEVAIERLRSVIDTGKNQWRITEEARLEKVRQTVDTAKKALGNGDLAEVQEAKIEEALAKNQTVEGWWNIRSFREVLDSMFGKASAIATTYGKLFRQAARNRTRAMIDHQDSWTKAIEKATGLKGRGARLAVWNMQANRTDSLTMQEVKTTTQKVPIDTFFDAENQKSLGLTREEIAALTAQFEALPKGSTRKYLNLTRTTTGPAKAIKLSQAEMIHLSMLWGQDGYKAGLTENGFGEAFQTQVEEKLSPAAKSLRSYMESRYEDDFPAMRDLYSRMYGIDLAKIENYAPGTFYSTGGTDTKIDPQSGLLSGGGFKQTFLKQRKQHLAKPRAENAFDVFMGHIAQAEHWKTHAELSREFNAVLGNPDVKVALEARSQRGSRALGAWMQSIDRNGVAANTQPSRMVQWLIQSQAYAAMAWKVSTALKNGFGAATNMAFHMPLGAYLSGMGRMLSPTGSGIARAREMWKSDLIQNRIKGGYSPEMREAISTAFFQKPSLVGDALIAGMQIHGYADAFGTSIGAAVAYDYHFRQATKQGIKEADAKAYALDEVAEGISRTAQPVELIDRSLMELEMKNPLAKLAFLFASEIRQKSSMYLGAWGNVATGNGTAKDAKIIGLMHLAIAPLMWAISSGMRDLTDDGDDDEIFDEKNWSSKELLIDVLLGPLGGIPLVRDVASALKGFDSSSSPLVTTAKAGMSLIDLFTDEPKGDEALWYEKKLLNVAKGITGTSAAAANIYKQVVGTARNLDGETE